MESRMGWLISALASVVLVACGAASSAVAAEIKVLSAGAVKAAVADLAESFQRETGHTLKFTFGTTGVIQRQLAVGEKADVVIMTDAAIDEQIQKGTVASGTRTDIARVGVGVCVREGAPLPDIATPEAFRRTLLAAKSIVYMDPAKGGTSGIHFAGVLERMGIAETLKGKTTLWPEGYAAEPVAKGEVELCVHQISEILAVKGVKLVGPLPQDFQKVTIYSAGLATGTTTPDAAKAFIASLMSPSARSKFVATGLDYKD